MHHGSTYQERLLILADILQLLIWLSDARQSQEHLLLALISSLKEQILGVIMLRVECI